ncbi:hypothetical protein VOLCADRAFT_85921 [Volvox carteri f. nagariensis]|uniref:Membrane bound O-acyl transferase n=1 Tax=Volvox carteri f. nagariensis TaxID=3068 RepID=D8THC8_VOLCA|nr:uncharacterized protein VOLCADRAFT_85921 [Volvox carteri f. nagariensis]EFJ52688.1 hypothetical protein VOLCADRAFT_85921 [Volvox carteri f. nagariensis]|eukprot:XP_002945693.1 hypothetical protein VOLCADRAFT_85921 [Volvox carteri f. nagariensis]
MAQFPRVRAFALHCNGRLCYPVQNGMTLTIKFAIIGTNNRNPMMSPKARAFPSIRQALLVALSLAFLCALHGACAVYVAALAAGAYVVSRRMASRPYGLLGVWVYACCTLLLARLLEGLPFAWISPSLAHLDRHRGVLRWHIHYNLLVLRFISFASDLHWARGGKRIWPPSPAALGAGAATASAGQKAALQGERVGVGGSGGSSGGGDGGTRFGDGGSSGVQQHVDAELRALSEAPLPLAYYSLMPFLEYCMYPPLYIAGPIITFNSFAAQRMLRRQRLMGAQQVLVYALRAALAWACLEGLTHALPYNSIAKYRVLDRLAARAAATPQIDNSGGGGGGWFPAPRPLHYAITGYWVLVFMWLKFTVIWRFFRLASLADGIVPPENMTRCVCNNYDIEGFWRSWHASYNRWLVRYMYIPLGGSRWRVINVWVIFTFVALWHDLEWRLLSWAWLMAAAVAPEMILKALARSAAARRWHGSAAFRHVCALAAAVNILMLMAANLVGFVVGVDGIRPLIRQVLGQPSFLAVVLLALFAAAQVMFWRRECEARAAATATTSAAVAAAEGAACSATTAAGCGSRIRTESDRMSEL